MTWVYTVIIFYSHNLWVLLAKILKKNGQYLFLNQGKFWSIHATVHVVGIYLQVFMHNKKNL